MAITEKHKKLFELFSAFYKELFCSAQEYVASNKYISSHFDFPIRDNDKNNGMPSIRKSFLNNEPKDYASIFSRSGTDSSKIYLGSIKYWQELADLMFEPEIVSLNYSLKNYPEDTYKSLLSYFILKLFDKYMHLYWHDGDDFHQDKMDDLIFRFFVRMFEKELYFSIGVPILILDFEETFSLTDNIVIRALTDEEQISRYSIGGYDSYREQYIIEEAKYVLELKNYGIDNNNFFSVTSTLGEKTVYPLQIIDNFFAALKIVTGYNTGYGQLMIMQDTWFNGEDAFLLPYTGTRITAFNYSLVEKKLWNEPIKIVKKEQFNEIKKVYNALSTSKPSSLNIAANRFNSCVLRIDANDAMIDSVIGLEALLTDNDHGEITYKVSTRLAALLSLSNCNFSCIEIKKAMGKIYNYRSKIVHGDTIKDSDTYIKMSNGNKLHVYELSLEYLKLAILTIIDHPDLSSPKNIDDFICKRFK